MRGWFESRGRAFAESNRRQALFPVGAEILLNPVGTAPGFCICIGTALVFALPGPPREMQPMLEHELLPRVEQRVRGVSVPARASFQLFGLPESGFADRCGAWMARESNPLMGVTARHGVLSVSLVAHGAQRETLLTARQQEFRARFPEFIFSETGSERLPSLTS